jgi:hypothetical protein
MSFSSTNNTGNIKPTAGITLSGLFLLFILALFLFPAHALANPGKTTTCLDCHTLNNSDPSIHPAGTGIATIYVAVDGVEHDITNTAGPTPPANYVLSSYTGAAQDVEIDYYYKDNTNSAAGESVSLWPIAPGTVNNPTGPNFGTSWSSAWDVATSNGGGGGETYYSVATGDPTYFPNSPDSYSIYWFDFVSDWEVGRNKGVYDDGVAGNPGDQDGWADTMGTDFIITVPEAHSNSMKVLFLSGIAATQSLKYSLGKLKDSLPIPFPSITMSG